MPKFLDSVNQFRIKHEPELLMGMGITGLVFSTVWAVKATIQAVRICDNKRANENKAKLTAKEVVKETWKLYLPAVVSTCISVPCIIAGNRISSSRNAALAAAYTMSEAALHEYQAKAKEIVGEKKEQDIRNAVAQDKIDNATPSKEIILSDSEEQLFLEPLSMRYFKSTWNKIQQAANEINEEALGSTTGSYSLNDWYDKLGLDNTEMGDMLGWCTPGYDYSYGLMKVSMDTGKTKDNKVCGCIHYDVRPYPINGR